MNNNLIYKKFCLITVLIVVAILTYNLVVWHMFTQQLLTRTEGVFTGDLARLSYLHEHTAPRKNTNNLARKHLSYADYTGQPIDIVTIGDSFSQGMGNGPNRYYQDYISTLQNMTVLNLPNKIPGARNFVETVAILTNSGFLERINPRFLLLERVERNVNKFGRTVNLGKTLSAEQIDKLFTNKTVPLNDDDIIVSDLPDVGFMNTGNFKWLWYNLGYHLSPNALTSRVYKEKLDRPLFSGQQGDSLLFHRKDLGKYLDKSKALDERTVRKVNNNLNRLASLLAENNIRLIFMPIPDKYSLYRPYLLNKRHSRSAFFEHLRWQPKSYQLIDTEEILSRELKSGVQDLYWIDDTHWSWKASKAIFEQFRFQ